MNELNWSQVAADDLQRIAEFIRASRPDLEQRTIGDIVDRVDLLRQYPRIGQRRETNEAGTGLRALLAGRRYRVVYEVHPNDEVEILQVPDMRSDNR